MTSQTHKTPSLLLALTPVFFLIGLLILSNNLFGDGAAGGPNQIGLISSAMVAAFLGLRLGYTWKEMEEAMVKGISLSMSAVFILLIVGSLIGTWILSGTVPAMVYYGLQLLNPSYFYIASCLICCIVSVATGSSWTTASTIGVALIGIATVLGLPLGLTAGAIISGAYFGDKMSPLSDTTNLAPAMAGTDLFTHINHMFYTTIPSLLIALVLFLIFGLSGAKTGDANDIQAIVNAIDANFSIGPHLLIPPALVIIMVVRKVPAFPALMIGTLIGGVFAVIFQDATLAKFINDPSHGKAWIGLKAVWSAMASGFSGDMGNEALTKLLNKGGMSSMLNTIWLILSAMMFGAAMEKTGMLEVIASKILGMVRSNGSLIVATLGTSIGMNVVASDQYIAIVLPGRMYRAEFMRRRLHPKNLSRCLEDAGTLTSVLVPWNTCGAFMHTTLGVATLTYLPYCFFNLLNPLISAIYGITGFTIAKMTDEEATEMGTV